MNSPGAVTAIPLACLIPHPGWRRMPRCAILPATVMMPFSDLPGLLPRVLASISGNTSSSRSIWAMTSSSMTRWLISPKAVHSQKYPINRGVCQHRRCTTFLRQPVIEMRPFFPRLILVVIPWLRLPTMLGCTIRRLVVLFANVQKQVRYK